MRTLILIPLLLITAQADAGWFFNRARPVCRGNQCRPVHHPVAAPVGVPQPQVTPRTRATAAECTAERETFLAADAALQESVAVRDAAETEAMQATAALAAAQARSDAADAAYVAAKAAVAEDTSTSMAAYQAYLECLIGDPATPEPQRAAARAALEAIK